MFDRLLMVSLLVVGLGLIYMGARAALTLILLGTRGAVLLWRLTRSRRVCPDCRRLGERCPWCADDLHRLGVGALAMILPLPAWLMMLRSPIEFPPPAKWAAGLWSVVWLGVGLQRLF
jgi:hypothetical protein